MTRAVAVLIGWSDLCPRQLKSLLILSLRGQDKKKAHVTAKLSLLVFPYRSLFHDLVRCVSHGLAFAFSIKDHAPGTQVLQVFYSADT